ncbi:AMP-binding enzyme-domain-containing protein [Schizophyllum commune]
MALSDYLATDDLTILLGLIAATLFLLQNLYKPQPLVHPILLGRQSDTSKVRNAKESPVYRNYGTGLMGRFPVRPNKDVTVLSDLVRSDQDTPRTLFNTKITNMQLQDRVASFGTGLLRLANLVPGESSVLLLLNDSIEFLISDLALSSHSIPSITLSSATLLDPVLEQHPTTPIITHVDFLTSILELIYESGDEAHHTIVVVGEPSPRVMASVASRITVLQFADVEREGFRVEKTLSPIPKPNDVFSLAYYPNGEGLQGVQLTHANLTAGVCAVKAMIPQQQAVSTLDTFVSAHSLSTAYGRAIAYAAVYEGVSFATLDSTKQFRTEENEIPLDVKDALSFKSYSIPSPTIMFLKPPHLQALVTSVLKDARKNILLHPFAWRHKVAGLAEGYLTKESLWDRLVYDAARGGVVGEVAGSLRLLVVSGGPVPAALLTPARIAFSVPLVNAFTSPLVAGPVLASFALDMQDFPAAPEEPAHVGPPSVNVEARLINVDEDAVARGEDPVGTLLIRGPSVGKPVGAEEFVNVSSGKKGSEGDEEDEGWLAVGVTARVQTNGAFQIVSQY